MVHGFCRFFLLAFYVPFLTEKVPIRKPIDKFAVVTPTHAWVLSANMYKDGENIG